MKRRSFIGWIGAALAIIATPPVRARSSARLGEPPPETLDELIARAEALWAHAEPMEPVAFVEFMQCDMSIQPERWPCYRAVPVTLRRRHVGKGAEAERTLIGWMWAEFVRASQHRRFADGMLLWRVKPTMWVDHPFLEGGTTYTHLRCRVAIVPHERHWKSIVSERQPFSATPEGYPTVELA